MAKVYDINLYQQGKSLTSLADPCTSCDDKLTCCHTCQRAEHWWATFTKKFKRQNVIHQLGGE